MSEISRSITALRIFGEDLDPDEIARILDRAPTRSYRKGDPIYPPKNMKPRPVGAWMIDSGEAWAEGDRLNEQIRDLLISLPDEPSLWTELAQRFDMDVFCGADVTDTSPGIRLERETLKLLADRYLEFDVCVYLDLERIRDHLDQWPVSDDHHPVQK
jgi:hypothetical protein